MKTEDRLAAYFNGEIALTMNELRELLLLSEEEQSDKLIREQLEGIPDNEMWRCESDNFIWFVFGNPLKKNKAYCFSTNSFYAKDYDSPTFTEVSDIKSARPATKEERQEVYKKERRMMPLHDFSDSWIGMKVYSINHGEGEITESMLNANGYFRVGFTSVYKIYNVDKAPKSLATRPIKIVEV